MLSSYSDVGCPVREPDFCGFRGIEEDLDWTRLKRPDGSAPIPPQDIQCEFFLSFSGCCRPLETTSEVVREVGLPTTRLFHENPTVGGLAAIHQSWDEQRSAWLAKQESTPNLAREIPLPATYAPEPLGTPDFN
jgi:hypothetical protein